MPLVRSPRAAAANGAGGARIAHRPDQRGDCGAGLGAHVAQGHGGSTADGFLIVGQRADQRRDRLPGIRAEFAQGRGRQFAHVRRLVRQRLDQGRYGVPGTLTQDAPIVRPPAVAVGVGVLESFDASLHPEDPRWGWSRLPRLARVGGPRTQRGDWFILHHGTPSPGDSRRISSTPRQRRAYGLTTEHSLAFDQQEPSDGSGGQQVPDGPGRPWAG